MGAQSCSSGSLPETLISRLRCPRCHSSLSGELVALTCVGRECGITFGSIGGIPALFDEEASLFSLAFAEQIMASQSGRGTLRKFVDRFLPSLDRNVSAVGNLERVSQQLLREHEYPTVLNLGEKHPSSASMALRANAKVQVVELDVRPNASTNLLADPISLPFADDTFDCVLAIAVLEHIIDTVACVSEIHRVLKPGGLVYSDAPFLLEVHAGAFDYLRLTPVGHRNLYRDFGELDSGVTQGPGVALSHSMQSFLLSFVERDLARFAIKAGCRLTLFWLRYVDLYLGRQPGARDCALGTYFTGIKDGRVHDRYEILETYRGISPDSHPGRAEEAARRRGQSRST